jgi:invasion protein IalB
MRKAKETRTEPGGSARRRLSAITLMAAVGLGAPAVFAQQGEQPAPAPQQQPLQGQAAPQQQTPPSQATPQQQAPQGQAAPQQGAPGQAPPAESKVTERQFKDWTVRCGRQNEQGPEVCGMELQTTDKEGRTVMAVAVGTVPGNAKLGLLIILPLRVLLPAGVTLQVDGGAEVPLQVDWCDRPGCRIEMLLEPDLLSRLKAGREAKVIFEAIDPEGQRRRLGYPISLLGFSSALDAVRG